MRKSTLGYVEGWLSVVINTALFAFKLWAGRLAGSVAMVADAWHTLSDTFTSVVVILGFWMASRPADGKHPFGHGRAESVCAIIIGTLLAVVGIGFLKESVQRLAHRTQADYTSLAIVVFAASFAVKEALARFSIWAGRKTGARSLVADGWHHRTDAIASGLIVAGAFLSSQLRWIDGALGVGVSLLILYAAYDIVKGAMSVSIGEAHSTELEERIRHVICAAVPSAGDVHHMHLHSYGDHMELTVHVRVDPRMGVEEAHALATRMAAALRSRMGIEATIHIEPFAEAGRSQARKSY